MTLTRRELLAALLVPAVISWKGLQPTASLTATTPAPISTDPSLGQIIEVAFEAAKNALLKGRNFMADELNDPDNVRLQPIGPVLVLPTMGPSDIQERHFDVQELSIPLVWTDLDDRYLKDKAQIAKSMIENALMSHDDHLIDEYLPDHRLVISKEYHYNLGPVHHFNLSNDDGTISVCHVIKLYTAFGAIPRDLMTPASWARSSGRS